MKLARYIGNGQVEIVDEQRPSLPCGGLVLRTEACGLCSGELMDWYMDRKLPHVLGHEICGIVVESDDARFPIGSRVAPHHHAPCLECEDCNNGRHVHCRQWRETKLIPGGMCEFAAVPKENLNDTYRVDNFRPRDAALLEPLACVMKSISRGNLESAGSVCVIGLGVMGLMHLAVLDRNAFGIDTSEKRVYWAKKQGFRAETSSEKADAVVVCPGTPDAFQKGLDIVKPGGTLVMFAPFSPSESAKLNWDQIYFDEIQIVPSYSCGPDDMESALRFMQIGAIRAESLVSDFIEIEELPKAYAAMKNGDILKAMVIFS